MSPARRCISAGLVALLLPVSALATVCAAWCAEVPAVATASIETAPTIAEASSPVTAEAPCAAAGLCAFAVTPAVPGHAISIAVSARANVAPDDPGARSVPADPAPPPEPPARHAPTA